LPIKKRILQLHKTDENLIFIANKYLFIHGQNLIKYDFSDWKYYLHYSLVKDVRLLSKAANKFKQGRLYAEVIHILR